METMTVKPTTTTELEAALTGFNGSDTFYKVSILSKSVITEGVRAMAELVGGYWLLDVINSYERSPKLRNEEFQIWLIEVKNGKAVVTCQADTNTPVLVKQKIEYTDFPEGTFKLWKVRNEMGAGTIMLPSEY